MSLVRNLCLGLCALILSGCDLSEIIASIVPDDAKPVLAEMVTAVSDHDLDPVLTHLPPGADPAAVEAGTQQILEALPEGEPDHVALTYANINSTMGLNSEAERTLSTVHTLKWGEQTRLLQIEMASQQSAPWVINSFRLEIPAEPEAAASPALSELSLTHKIFGATAIIVPIFVLFTLIAMFRTPLIKRRILWAAFIVLACYPQFAINWSTGDWWLASPAMTSSDAGVNFSFFNILFFGASIMREGLAGAWTVSVCVPLGALFFWYRRMRGGPTRKAAPASSVEGEAGT